eukprot:3353049-Pyramimonas_sp.AAC.1
MISFRCSDLVSFTALRGVKQGCPLSGVLFAFALDPLLRWLHRLPLEAPKRVTAFADDLGLTSSDIYAVIPAVVRQIGLCGSSGGLI